MVVAKAIYKNHEKLEDILPDFKTYIISIKTTKQNRFQKETQQIWLTNFLQRCQNN
jgi:hypothetical protein